MCVPACTQKIAADVSRRSFLRRAAGVAAVTALAGCTPVSTTPPAGSAAAANLLTSGHTFSRILDLTHTLAPNFPTFGGSPQLELETLYALASDGYNMYRWLLVEHTGTHMDAPFHFSDGPSADQIPVEDLMGPLVVVDIRSKAEADPDAQLTPDDLAAWESENGPIPDGAIVAMNSGWDAFVGGSKFRNADDAGVMHFPGFHIEAIEMLLGERNAKGIFVDTLSLDFGPSPDFAVHYRWLPAGKWGIECVANLSQLPAKGAIAIVGGPKIAGATGGPSRIFALV
ncbi:MAG TPA: cyclase [Chloroflexi bacterium]|nr:cyclase [Chloroflexota bacterium]HHW85657.1 cyclase family protein [Chloroflexota bacterium]